MSMSEWRLCTTRDFCQRLAWSLALACSTALAAAPALETPPRPSPNIAVHPDESLLAAARAALATTHAQDRTAARRLMLRGDRAYRLRQYAQASAAYGNAYPNAPMAYAYVMAGDAHWRDVLQVQAAARAASSSSACPLDNRFFPRDLRQGLRQQQALGLALAGPTLRASWWYVRAHRSTVCLQDLAVRAAQRPPGECADLPALRACLGPPLPSP